MSVRRLIRSGSAVLRAITAMLLLAASLGDLAIDGDCDPLSLTAGGLVVTVAADGDADACARGCIPDCFCCSRSETAGPALMLPGLTAQAQGPPPNVASVPAVVLAVPEPPPLALS